MIMLYDHSLHHFKYILDTSVKYWMQVVFLPRKGYKCITIGEELHATIKKRAQETNRTMKEYVEYLLTKEKTVK